MDRKARNWRKMIKGPTSQSRRELLRWRKFTSTKHRSRRARTEKGINIHPLATLRTFQWSAAYKNQFRSFKNRLRKRIEQQMTFKHHECWKKNRTLDGNGQ